MTADQALYNRDRQGTLIIGDHRFGSHFLQAVIVERMGGDCQPLGQPLSEDRGYRGSAPDFDGAKVVDRLCDLTNQPGYACVIVNDMLQKLAISERPDLLSQWHVIRLTRADKIKWFISYWLYIHHPESDANRRGEKAEGFHHHGTPRDNYATWMRRNGRVRLDGQDILELQLTLAGHLLNYAIAADHEIDYEQLPALANHKVIWQANQYPSDRLADMFEDAHLLEGLLRLWGKVNVEGQWRGHAA